MNIGEVDEGIANIASGSKVNAKVEEVVGAKAELVEKGLECEPVHLVGNVAKHDGGANVAAVKDALAANTVVLVMRMAASCGDSVGVRIPSRTISDNATLIIDTRLVTVRRVESTRAGPLGHIDGVPQEVVEGDTPEWNALKRLDSAIGGIDGLELDAEDEEQLDCVCVDMNEAADSAKDGKVMLKNRHERAEVVPGEFALGLALG